MTTSGDQGRAVEYTVTYLEMAAQPVPLRHSPPSNLNIALIKAVAPPVDYFLYLYELVGADYEWTDWLQVPRRQVEEFVDNRAILLYTLMLDGSPGGFFMLDLREQTVCDLAYFGLAPRAIGRGLGTWLLSNAVETGWQQPGVEKMTVNTNTLDHPRALGLYQRIGFQPVRRESMRRVVRESG